MKKYIIALVIAVLAIFSSCKKENLVIDQQGVFSVVNTYTQADDKTILSFLSGVYSTLYGNALDGFASYNTVTGVVSTRRYLEEMGGDDASYWSFTESAESPKPYKVFWGYSYSIIYDCNLIIANLPTNTVATESVRNRAIAEARAIRAIQMMYLVQLYGTPPLADHIMTGNEGNTPAATSWAFIEKELAEAAEGLPSKANVNGQSAIGGRLTKEAAYAYLGKALLWEAKYTEAANILYSKVIATNLYSLIANFSELNRYTADFCPEYMWEYELSSDPNYKSGQAGPLGPAFLNWSVTSMYTPDGYYTNQGYGYHAYPSESFGAFMDAHDVVGGVESIRYKGTLATYEDMLDATKFTYTGTGGSKGMKQSQSGCEGYFNIKGIPRKENIVSAGSFWYSDIEINNWCFMRYSEVLLNYAEAVAKGGTPGAISGLQALNIVRERAGLTDAPALDMENTTYGVKAERRAELYNENARFIDLVRWGDAATVLANVGKTIPAFYGYLDGTHSAPESKANWKVLYTAAAGQGFKAGKHELWAIPQIERNNNPNLTQNPGW